MGKGKPVLFVTGLGRSLERAENIRALYDAYHGEKALVSSHDPNYVNVAESGNYDLMVIDVFPTDTRLKTIMVWHAIQGGKYIGLDQRNTYYRPEYADLITRIVAAGRGGVDMFHRCTGVPKDRILNLGMPRTDALIGHKKEKSSVRTYLYAPTFRTLHEDPIPPIDFGMIDSMLTDNELLIVKAHPYGCSFGLYGYRHIMEAPKMDKTADYLLRADVVITDYSSIMFDAWLLNVPVVLFEKEPGYVDDRGMYLKYPQQYCTRYTKTEWGLVTLARDAKTLRSEEIACRDYVADMCDGHSCERICKLIDEMR